MRCIVCSIVLFAALTCSGFLALCFFLVGGIAGLHPDLRTLKDLFVAFSMTRIDTACAVSFGCWREVKDIALIDCLCHCMLQVQGPGGHLQGGLHQGPPLQLSLLAPRIQRLTVPTKTWKAPAIVKCSLFAGNRNLHIEIPATEASRPVLVRELALANVRLKPTL